MWQGDLVLKGDASRIQMHYVAGNKHLSFETLPQPIPASLPALNPTLQSLTISQRMNNPSQAIYEFNQRIVCEDNYCLLVAVACGTSQTDLTDQTLVFNDKFIKYFSDKQSAALVQTPDDKYIHIFPPSDMVDDLVSLHGCAELREQLRNVPHAVVIILNVGLPLKRSHV